MSRSATFPSQPGPLPLNSKHIYAITTYGISRHGRLQGVLSPQTKWGSWPSSPNMALFRSFWMSTYSSGCLDKRSVIYEWELRAREADIYKWVSSRIRMWTHAVMTPESTLFTHMLGCFTTLLIPFPVILNFIRDLHNKYPLFTSEVAW